LSIYSEPLQPSPPLSMTRSGRHVRTSTPIEEEVDEQIFRRIDESKNYTIAIEELQDDTLVANYGLETHNYRVCYATTQHDSIDENAMTHEVPSILESKDELNDAIQDRINVKYNDEQHIFSSTWIKIHTKSALSTRGRNLIVTERNIDSTGLMIWPASHLLCQYLAYKLSSSHISELAQYSFPADRVFRKLSPKEKNENKGLKILELGCGCGIVGITAAMTARRFRNCDDIHESFPHLDIVSTDGDAHCIKLCRDNILLNGDREGNVEGVRLLNKDVNIFARRLMWGDTYGLQCILTELKCNFKSKGKEESAMFDIVIGADIVYPDTPESVLDKMFQTVQEALGLKAKQQCHKMDASSISPCFILSFATRDGFRTPLRLINAATRSCFRIEAIPHPTFLPIGYETYLPPLLDSRLLQLTPTSSVEEAQNHNNSLGYDGCLAFPGLREAIVRWEEQSSDDEEWIAPFASDDEEC